MTARFQVVRTKKATRIQILVSEDEKVIQKRMLRTLQQALPELSGRERISPIIEKGAFSRSKEETNLCSMV